VQLKQQYDRLSQRQLSFSLVSANSYHSVNFSFHFTLLLCVVINTDTILSLLSSVGW